MRVDYRRYNTPSVVFPCVAVTVLLLLGAFLMRDSHHTHRWIHFGIFTFQPSEIAKPALVLFLAWFLQDRMHQTAGLAQRPAAGGIAEPAVHRAHFEGAGPGHGAGLRGCDGADALSGGRGDEVPFARRGRGRAGALLHALPCGRGGARACWRFLTRKKTRRAPAFTSCNRSSPWARAAFTGVG